VIHYRRLRGAGAETFSTYLLGQVVSFSLLAFGREPLHGTVSVVDGEAIAFLGDCGYGKSTLGAAMLARGFPLLTDDLIALGRGPAGYRVEPGLPRVKLFPEVSRALLNSAHGERMNPGTPKLILPLGESATCRRRTPLQALYVLANPAVPADRVTITPLARSEAMVEVLRNTFNTIVIDPPRLERQFHFASDLVRHVPVRRLAYPRRLSALAEVRDTILADLSR
jgi:hypothetical protein